VRAPEADLWRWPLWSWRHLAVTVLVAALLLAGLGRVAATGDAATRPAPSAAPTPVSGTPSAAATAIAPDPADAVTPTPSTTPVGGASSAEAVATAFVRAWARPDSDPETWGDACAAYATARFAARIRTADPARVPASRVLPGATVSMRTDRAVKVRVPTDAGAVLVSVVNGSGSWRVDDIAPDDPVGDGSRPGG
jgi:hypothetical protein